MSQTIEKANDMALVMCTLHQVIYPLVYKNQEANSGIEAPVPNLVSKLSVICSQCNSMGQKLYCKICIIPIGIRKNYANGNLIGLENFFYLWEYSAL